MREKEIAEELGKQFHAAPLPFVEKSTAKAGCIFALRQFNAWRTQNPLWLFRTNFGITTRLADAKLDQRSQLTM